MRRAGLRGGGYCFTHSPATAEARITARQRGGANSAKIIRLRSLIPPRLLGAYELLEKALGDVLQGSLEPRQAMAAAAVARAMVAVLTAGELEERVRQLEQGEGDAAGVGIEG